VNPEWHTFLTTAGGHPDDQGFHDFGDPSAELKTASGGDVLVDISHLTLLRVRGDDADAFLQGQFSNDIRQLTRDKSQITSYSTPKGRMLGIFRLNRTDDGLLMQMPTELAPSISQRLKMFIMRSKVGIENADDLAGLGLSGPSVPGLVEEQFGKVPAAVNDCVRHERVLIVSIAGPHPRFQLVGPVKELKAAWQALGSKARPCGYPVWRWLDIEAGQPSIWPATSELFVPQNVNLERLGGVNFKKGCYPGQEIVARMQYLGKLKQRMVHGHLDSDRRPKPGDTVYTKSYGDQAAGAVVDAQPSPAGGYDLLVVAPIEGAADARLYEPEGPSLNLSPPPYLFDDAQPATTR